VADNTENKEQADVAHAKVVDVEVEEAWERLKRDPGAVLIDVRTQAEWTFVGVPDLSSLGKQLLLMEWQSFPENEVNPTFTSQLESELAAYGAGKDTDLFFICRSGHRSFLSGEAMAATGYSACHNVAGGFEGPHDSETHRGLVAGWKAAGLPWVQR
jgi:rhodanese-related sulfurtransferase